MTRLADTTRVQRGRRGAFLLGVWVAAFVGAFENTGMRPAYPEILRDLGGGGTDVSVFSTTFMVGGFVTAMVVARSVRRDTVVRMLCLASIVQMIGLAVCLASTDLWSFLGGRLVQGAGEGVLVMSVFFCISSFVQPGRARNLGYASVSVAWLIASGLSPILYSLVQDRPWDTVLVLLIIGSAVSVGLVGYGRAAVGSSSGAEATPSDRRITTPAAYVQLGFIAAALFAYSQFAGVVGSLPVVVLAGVVVLATVVLGTFRGRGLLRVRSGITRFLFVRGVVSAVYSAGLSFASVALFASSDADQAEIAVVTSLAAVGWTAGALAQARLHLGERQQLSLGLSVLAAGLLAFVCGLHAASWASGSGMFAAGLGIGIAANALPGFVASVVPETELSQSLTGLEVVDTVATTVVLVVVGAVMSSSSADGVPTDSTLRLVYGALAAVAVIAAVWIARLRRPSS